MIQRRVTEAVGVIMLGVGLGLVIMPPWGWSWTLVGGLLFTVGLAVCWRSGRR